MKRLSFAVLALSLVACSDTTAPRTIKAPAAPSRDLECRSGYSVATGRNGEQICVPDGEAGIQAIPRAFPDTL